MGYKDLLVQVDDSAACSARVDAAIELADRFDAHLTALYLIPEVMLPIAVEGYVGADIQASIERHEQERAETVLEQFKKAAEREDLEYDTRVDRGPVADFSEMLELHSRYADLLVLGQPDEAGEVGTAPLPGDVVLHATAPVLTVPFIGLKPGFGKRPMIAWNASREAARAVRNAMPFLEGADKVDVVTVHPRSGATAHGDLPGADIALHLARHGIEVDVQRLEGEDIDVGNAILSHAADRGNDLLVMGCYGHSRLREWMLGGATRTILQSMTLPVIMAH
ncbi:MAG: universal stress protein [Alphaproteobacteria bacterium]